VLGGVALFGAVGLAVFTLMPKKGRLVIDVSDAGNTKVEVFVDGTKRCDTVPCVVGDVAPGARTIKVLPQGAAPLPPQEAIVERGEDKPVTFSMVAQSHEGATSATAHAPGAISEVKPIETAPLTPPPEAPPPPAPDGSTTPPPQLPTQEGLTPSARPTSTPASAPAQGNGTLNINSIPVSKVILDGRPLGNTPRVGLSVPPGTHTVVFVHPEKGRQTVSISVKPGETKTAAVKFR
jgi:serine/threonine-protein kinase